MYVTKNGNVIVRGMLRNNVTFVTPKFYYTEMLW
jgi:hypothetical protein